MEVSKFVEKLFQEETGGQFEWNFHSVHPRNNCKTKAALNSFFNKAQTDKNSSTLLRQLTEVELGNASS
jgi:hypothetical protein